MSVKILPRELGCLLKCDAYGCSASLQTGQILKSCIREYAKTLGWGRGLRPNRKRLDLCFVHMPIERDAHEKAKAAREQKRLERDEKRRAKEAKAA